LALDSLELDMTPSKLISVIQKLLEPAGEDCRVIGPRRQQQLIFFMPSAIGDIPPLARFREALDGRVRFEVIKYPKLNELVNGGAEFNTIVDAAVVQILASCSGQEALNLVGYSFGGFVAWESARRLIEFGHRVDFVGLIDSRLVSPQRERKSAFSKAIRYMRNPKQIYQDGPWWLAEHFVRECPLSLLGRIDHLLSLLPGAIAFRFRLYLQMNLRSNAFRRWTATPLGVPVALFRSDEWSMDAPDYGWGALCRRLVVLPVGGDHHSLLESRFRKSLCSQFLRAVETARAFAERKNQGPLYARRDLPK
jgi:thioesterase domain-containing protein